MSMDNEVNRSTLKIHRCPYIATVKQNRINFLNIVHNKLQINFIIKISPRKKGIKMTGLIYEMKYMGRTHVLH